MFYFGEHAAPVTKWRVEGFKGIESAETPLEGTNFLSGINSSGKSSLLQSLLLLAQSSSRDIILNGTILRLGNHSDVVNESSNHIVLEWELDQSQPDRIERPARMRETIVTRIHLRGPKLPAQPETPPLSVSEVEILANGAQIFHASTHRVELKTREANNPNGAWGQALLRVKSIEGKKAPGRTFVTFSGFYPHHAIHKFDASRLVEEVLKKLAASRESDSNVTAFEIYDAIHELRENARFRAPGENLDGISREVFEITNELLEKPLEELSETSREKVVNVVQKLSNIVAEDGYIVFPMMFSPEQAPLFGRRSMIRTAAIRQEYRHAWDTLQAAFTSLKRLADSIAYLGPLREEPKVLSSTGGRNPVVPVGIRGEYTADYLLRNMKTAVAFIDPDGTKQTSPLREAVGTWAAWLGVGDSVDVVDRGKLGRGLTVRVNGKERDLTTIGVGVSQLLPVITIALSVPPNSLVMLEQPELHLHPAVQSRLANFFFSARPDVSMIIETHSEYLITRARRIAIEPQESGREVSFLFAHPSEFGSRIAALQLGPLGDISEWPAGFFDTQDKEGRDLILALAKRRGGRFA